MGHRTRAWGRVTVLAVVFAVGLTAAGSPDAPAGAQSGRRYLDRVFTEVVTTTDIVYGAAIDEHGATQQLHLDLYQPAGDTVTARPVILLAHGGYFSSGHRRSLQGEAAEYARRGYVAASIEYRMDEEAGLITYPPDDDDLRRIQDAVHDMQAAVRWMRAQATTHRLDPGKISVGGYSAGAVMSVLTATSPDDPGDSGNPGYSSAVCTAVSRAGAGLPERVGPGDAGALFVHGARDFVVPYQVATETHDAMAAAGLPTRMATFANETHNPPIAYEITTRWLYERMVQRTRPCGEADPTAPAFVRAAYADLLGRPPTPAELERETSGLDAGFRRDEALTRLTRTDEWLGSIVDGFYRATLDREPDPAGVAFWVEEIRSGRRSVARVASDFYGSAEYVRARGSREAWVADLYRAVLGRDASAEDVAYWVGVAAVHNPTVVAIRIYGSVESGRARVDTLYRHLLGRSAEPAGRDYWAARVVREGDLALARSLAASSEYGTRAVARFPA